MDSQCSGGKSESDLIYFQEKFFASFFTNKMRFDCQCCQQKFHSRDIAGICFLDIIWHVLSLNTTKREIVAPPL
jgi:hypothetical protein